MDFKSLKKVVTKELKDKDTTETEFKCSCCGRKVKVLLEMIQEQLKSDAPKKNRIGKALVVIKSFVGEFSMKLAVTLAAGAVTGTDWNMLLQQLESFIK